MSERSIPEILGWEPAPADWGYVDRYFQHPTAGYAVNEHGGWSVDDLLAWIRHAGYWWDAGDLVPLRPGVDLVEVTYAHDPEWTEHEISHQATGHTLLEALEAAVRAIDAGAT